MGAARHPGFCCDIIDRRVGIGDQKTTARFSCRARRLGLLGARPGSVLGIHLSSEPADEQLDVSAGELDGIAHALGVLACDRCDVEPGDVSCTALCATSVEQQVAQLVR